MIKVNCYVCGSPRAQKEMPLFDHFGDECFFLYRCSDCTFLYMRDVPDATQLQRYYSHPGSQLMHSGGSSLFERLRNVSLRRETRVFLPLIRRGAWVADLGAGDGSFLKCIVEQGYRGLALDLYEAKKWTRPSIEYRQAVLHGAAFDPKWILVDGKAPELVIMRHSLEHVLEPQQLIRKLGAAGVKYLWIVVPNCSSVWAQIFGGYWYYWDPPRHLSYFTPRTLARLLGASGYRRLRASRYFGIDEWVTSLYRYLSIRWRGTLPAPVIDLFNPKSPLAALSSAVGSTVGAKGAYGVLVELGDNTS
jgi:hypothetical protein